MKRMGRFYGPALQCLIVLVATQCFLVNCASSSISSPKTEGDCTTTNFTEAVKPCVDMVNAITVSGLKPVTSATETPAARMKGILAGILKGMCEGTVTLDASLFEKICADMKVISTCLKNTIKCNKNLNAKNKQKINDIFDKLPISKETCNPVTGVVNANFKTVLNDKQAGECLKGICKTNNIKQTILRAVNSLSKMTVDTKAIKKGGNAEEKKAHRKSQTVCNKVKGVGNLLSMVKGCNQACDKDSTLQNFRKIFGNLLGMQGNSACSKPQKGKGGLSTLGIYGCSHLQNTGISEDSFETLDDTGNLTVFRVKSFEIACEFKKVANTGKICVTLGNCKVNVFGKKQFCGSTDEKPDKEISFADLNTFNVKEAKTEVECDDKKKIMVFTQKEENKVKGKPSYVLKIRDQCGKVNARVRMNIFDKAAEKIPATYVTLRGPKMEDECSGKVCSGSENTVDTKTGKRSSRRKRSVGDSAFQAAGDYDAAATGVADMSAGMALSLTDQKDVEAADDSLLDGATTITVNTLLMISSVFVTLWLM